MRVKLADGYENTPTQWFALGARGKGILILILTLTLCLTRTLRLARTLAPVVLTLALCLTRTLHLTRTLTPRVVVRVRIVLCLTPCPALII